MKSLIPIAVLVFLPACHIWFGGDDCLYQSEADPVPLNGLLNPYSGQCEYFGGGGGGSCGDYGGYDDREAEPAAQQDWGQCISQCTGLDESSCQAAPGCRRAYVGDCSEGALCESVTYTFAECWQGAPSGPVRGEACEGLDAYECSRHDDCAAYHFPAGGCTIDPAGECSPFEGDAPGGATEPALLIGNFERCGAEPAAPQGCYGSEECPSGSVCNAAEVCLPPPGCNSDPSTGCPAVCYGYCVPDGEAPVTCAAMASEAECIAADQCTPVYQGVSCTCDAAGVCTCESLDYDGCTDV